MGDASTKPGLLGSQVRRKEVLQYHIHVQRMQVGHVKVQDILELSQK